MISFGNNKNKHYCNGFLLFKYKCVTMNETEVCEMDNLYNYLVKEYGYDEPIFSEDLKKEFNIKKNTLRQQLKRLTDDNKIQRCSFRDGIYFIPDPDSILKKSALSVNKIIKNKYLFKKNQRIGYVTGLDFANSLKLTTQVPGMIEIVTKNETSNKRYVEYNKRRVALTKAKIDITENNYKILQIIELINNFKKVSDMQFDRAIPKILDYIKNVKIDEKELYSYLSKYPRALKEFMGSGLYSEITRR